MLPAELYAINYVDKHVAKLVFKYLLENSTQLEIISMGLERYKARRNRSLKIVLAIPSHVGKNLTAILKGIKESLVEHPLYSYLCFDFHIDPLSLVEWNFDSYDDPNFQQIFIRKRQFS